MFLCVSYEMCPKVVHLGVIFIAGIYPFSEYFGVMPDITETEVIRRRQLQQRLEKLVKKKYENRKKCKIEQERYGGSGEDTGLPLTPQRKGSREASRA
jgi:hypothetical protein